MIIDQQRRWPLSMKSILLSGLICSLIGGCSWFQKEPDAITEIFQQTAKQKWYCYTDANGEDWDCGLEARDLPPEQLAASPASTPDITAAEAYILNQPAGAYAVQLMAHWDEDRLKEYGSQLGLQEPLLQARVSDKETSWRVLLLGVYADRAAADSVLADWLGDRELDAEPWIRAVQPLQESIQNVE
jgi:septal ring-binding cell division protein DamX